MSDALLVLNAGSSSLKFAVYLEAELPQPWLRGHFEGLQTAPRFIVRNATEVIGDRQWTPNTRLGHDAAIEFLFSWGRSGVMGDHRLAAVGHRVVHGGSRFTAPCLVDDEVLAGLESLVPLAPLHQPHNLAAMKAVAQQSPGLPQVACFDTAFHSTQPEVARTFALPRSYTEQGVRRYGFHGLSCEYVASVLEGADEQAARGRTVIAHLGNGASLTAMQEGRSVATTMGFTALDGLVMGTRCGSLDPGALLYLQERYGLSTHDLHRVLYQESGLLGVSGISSDMRELLASTDRRAAEAIDLFVYRIGREIGSLAAALGGLDALVFTGGIGENSDEIRTRVCRASRWLGVHIDARQHPSGVTRISAPYSPVAVWVIPANEEAIIASHTRRLALTTASGWSGTYARD